MGLAVKICGDVSGVAFCEPLSRSVDLQFLMTSTPLKNLAKIRGKERSSLECLIMGKS